MASQFVAALQAHLETTLPTSHPSSRLNSSPFQHTHRHLTRSHPARVQTCLSSYALLHSHQTRTREDRWTRPRSSTSRLSVHPCRVHSLRGARLTTQMTTTCLPCQRLSSTHRMRSPRRATVAHPQYSVTTLAPTTPSCSRLHPQWKNLIPQRPFNSPNPLLYCTPQTRPTPHPTMTMPTTIRRHIRHGHN
jgi:hypothetical protein